MIRALGTILAALLFATGVHGQVTMYTMNLQHGKGTDDAFNFQRQVDAIVDGDIIAVQEKGTSETSWTTPLANAGFTQAVYRENSTLADGNALWVKTATVTVHATFDVRLSVGFLGSGGVDVDKSAVAADVTVDGKRFTVVSTHLCWSACSEAQRIDQAEALLAWRTSDLPAGRDVVLLGDFNFPPSATSLYNLFTADYVDLWEDGISKSIATANWGDRDSSGTTDMPVNSNSITHDTRRIDYGWLNSSPATLSLSSISMPDLRATCPHALVDNGGLPACTPEVVQLWDVTGDFGVKPTDHNIIKFVFVAAGPRTCNFHTAIRCQ